MKQTILKLMTGFMLCPVVMFANPNNTGVKSTVKTFTGYWIATTTNDEKVIVRETIIPEEALVRNEQGEFAGVKMDLLDKALNYSAITSIQGAAVKYNQIVVEENKDTNLQANLDEGTTTLQDNEALLRKNATLVCWGVFMTDWEVPRPCTYVNKTYCIAVHIPSGKVYTVFCK